MFNFSTSSYYLKYRYELNIYLEKEEEEDKPTRPILYKKNKKNKKKKEKKTII